ncbi:hypothetical protein [Streptomyces javensis]|uniref:Uncharacterized protein n=1 Tax=Streptomyces javensis TaxID=114698 RepID=A0ABS0R5E3_9ACTN|nr:hypothetical protein [Streptomyces javensis]MBI0312602.1 hypothetical protein [Streptomyces javensis]
MNPLTGFAASLLSVADPLLEQVSAPVTHRIGERAGQVAGPGDIRAGEPEGKRLLLLAAGERVTRRVIQEVVLAGAGEVGPDRFGGARARGGEVFAGDLAAAEAAAFTDLREQAGAADPGDRRTPPPPPGRQRNRRRAPLARRFAHRTRETAHPRFVLLAMAGNTLLK